MSLRARNRPWVRCGVNVVDIDVVNVDVEDVDVDVLFADDHYVCSSVAGSLCSRRCATDPLWDYVNVRLLLGQDFEPVSSRIGLFTICTRISICIAVGPFQLATPLQTALSAIKEIPQL